MPSLTVTSDGIFSGYVSVYDVPSSAGHVIRPGAFDVVMENKEPGDIRMLLHHDPTKPCGVWLEWRSDDIGLWMRGKLALDSEDGADAKALIEAGAIEGLSIAFTIVEGTDDNVTLVDLYEVSIVTFQAAEAAQIDEADMLKMYDNIPLADVKPHRTPEGGYLVATARVARTGIQLYRGAEVGKPQMDVVRVYRPPEHVFDEAAMRSFAHRPITLDHPREPVTAKNWKKYSRGYTGGDIDGRDGKFISVPLVVMDQEAIDAVESGKKELSMGYMAHLDWTSGTDPDTGETYDAVQTSIRANHLAIVTEARGGPELKIGDAMNKGDAIMPGEQKTTQIMIDGQTVEVLDVSARTIMNKLAAIEAEAADLRTKLKAEQEKSKESEKKGSKDEKTIADATTSLTAKDAEIATLKKQVEDAKLTPQKLDQMVQDRATVIGKARAVIGDKLITDGKTDGDIRRQVVDTKMGDQAKGWDDNQVAASFNTITSDVKLDQQDGATGVARHIQDQYGRPSDPRVTSYQAYDTNITSAWKNPGSAARQ